jgi:hypothetical protein
MSLDNFIPAIWSGQIQRALQTSLVYPQLMNRDHEGEIAAAGDTVKINMIGDVTVFDYVKNTDMSAPQALTDAQLTLKVDQAKAFNFAIDDIDKAQQTPKVMGEASIRAGYGLRKATDSFCASQYVNAQALSTANQAAAALGSDATPITGTWTTDGTRAYDKLVDLGVLLDTTDTPDEGRFVVVPPWYEAYLLKDARFTSFATADAMRNLIEGSLTGRPETGMAPGGLRGRAAGFDIYVSNQVPNTTQTLYKVIAGHPMAWSFADNIVEVEGYRPEKRFGDALKGLHVYGAKVVRPANLAVLTANPT